MLYNLHLGWQTFSVSGVELNNLSVGSAASCPWPSSRFEALTVMKTLLVFQRVMLCSSVCS
jgi:hypothetical protein